MSGITDGRSRTLTRLRRSAVAAVLMFGAVVAGQPTGPAPAAADVPDDGMPDQGWLDQTANAGDFAGLWGDAPGGVAGRPFVVRLTVVNGAERVDVVAGGTVDTPTSSVPGTVATAIAPFNLCKKAGNNQNQCYPSPNRLGITLGYVKASGQLGRNFTEPTGQNGLPLDLPVDVDADTEVEIVIDMNDWGRDLRWTWMNGEPSSWRVDGQGSDGAVVTMRFRLATGPSQACSTAIPVMACDPARAAENNGGTYAPVRQLRGDLVMSLDETGVPREFNGALFASSNADIGSLEAGPAGGSASITYGIVGPPQLDGAANEATFSAFVSDASLVNYFGATPDIVATSAFRDSALAVSRADGGAGGAPSWTRWSSAANGTAGWFLTVDDIRFNGAEVAGGVIDRAAGTRRPRLAQPAKIEVAPSVRVNVSARRSGGRVNLDVRARAGRCATSACRVVVAELPATPFSVTTTRLAVAKVRGKSRDVVVSAKISLAAKKRISVQLQYERGDRWLYVGSATSRP